MNLFGSGTRASGQGLSLVSTWMRQGVIRSIQTGSIDLNNVTSNTAPINVVNLANTVLISLGSRHNLGSSVSQTCTYHLQLTNSTTVTATRFTSDANTFAVGYAVVEFLPGIIRSVQSGTIELNGSTSNTFPITAVNTAKAFVIHLGTRYNTVAAANVNQRDSILTLTNATTVTASCFVDPGFSHLTSFMVVELF